MRKRFKEQSPFVAFHYPEVLDQCKGVGVGGGGGGREEGGDKLTTSCGNEGVGGLDRKRLQNDLS